MRALARGAGRRRYISHALNTWHERMKPYQPYSCSVELEVPVTLFSLVTQGGLIEKSVAILSQHGIAQN